MSQVEKAARRIRGGDDSEYDLANYDGEAAAALVAAALQEPIALERFRVVRRTMTGGCNAGVREG